LPGGPFFAPVFRSSGKIALRRAKPYVERNNCERVRSFYTFVSAANEYPNPEKAKPIQIRQTVHNPLKSIPLSILRKINHKNPSFRKTAQYKLSRIQIHEKNQSNLL
jgi:hypothetical protein